MSAIQYFDLGNNTLLTGTIPDCIGTDINPVVFDLSAKHPGAQVVGLVGEFPVSILTTWTDVAAGYLSLYNQLGMSGRIAGNCLDIRFCFQHLYLLHGDLTWASSSEDVPGIVIATVEKALANR
jgi:hypothetical protein